MLGKRKKTKNGPRQNFNWQPPPANRIKLNVDGSTRGSPGASAIGGLGRAETGNWIFGFAGKIEDGFAITAEIKAIIHGLQIAWEKGYRDVIVNRTPHRQFNSYVGTRFRH